MGRPIRLLSFFFLTSVRLSKIRERAAERQKEYRQCPEVKERRMHKQSPEYKRKEAKYGQRPDIRERRNAIVLPTKTQKTVNLPYFLHPKRLIATR